MKLKVLKHTSTPTDGLLEDYRAGVQLENAAVTALKKAYAIFKKVAASKDASQMESQNAKQHMDFIQEALDAIS